MKTRKRFWPLKYYRGLTAKNRELRKKEIEEHSKINWKNSRAYKPFKTDIGRKTRKSPYTIEWNRRFPDAKSLEERSKATGVPVRFLKEVFDRAMAAWRTGHRPGVVSPQGWTYPRVSSFLLCGKTHYTADADLVSEAKRVSSKARAWWDSVCK